MERSGFFTVEGHRIQSITLGDKHNIMVIMKGAVFGFGHYDNHQLGVVVPSALSGDTISTPTKVFAAVVKFNKATKLPNGKEVQ